MDNTAIYNLGDKTIAAAATDEVITSGTSVAGVAQALIDRLAGMISVSLTAKFIYGGGGTTCIAIVETRMGGTGEEDTDWIEIARFDFAQASATKACNVSAEAAAAVAAVAALSADSKRDGILGDRLRCRLTSTGTYTSNTSLIVRASVR